MHPLLDSRVGAAVSQAHSNGELMPDFRNHRIVILGVLLGVLAGCAATGPRDGAAPAFLPQPTEIGPEDDDELAERRAEWIESLHMHAPDVDWRLQDEATRRQLRALRASRGSVPGIWTERGVRNQAGRVSDADFDAQTNRLTVFSHGGHIWRSERDTIDWQSVNDRRRFATHYATLQFERLDGSPEPGRNERWVAADDLADTMVYSDDAGATWRPAAGPALANWLETTWLASRARDGLDLYALVSDYNFDVPAWQSRLLASNDRGTTWIDLGFLATPDKTALSTPKLGSDAVFLLVGNVVSRIDPGNAITPVATIAAAPAQAPGDRVALASGVAGDGHVFLYAFFESGNQTHVFRSVDDGATWSARGVIPQRFYFRVAAGTSLHDPERAYFGNIDMWRSTDGGLTFTRVNNWYEYYGDPANKLHADISLIEAFPDANGNEVLLIATDGGLYESTDGALSVENLSLLGLRQAQYYSSYTRRAAPHSIAIGAQDQGYQRAESPTTGLLDADQVISGDYGHLASSDGITVWMNYPTFTQLDPDPSQTGQPLPSWDFAAAGLTGMAFMAPLAADPLDPHAIWLGGGASVAGKNHLIHLSWNGSVAPGTISAVEGSFDFGGTITAIESSPQDANVRFVMAKAPDNAPASRFFRSLDGGATWTATADQLPQGHYFYGQDILADPARPGTVYVCGSGYSGPGVYVSTDNGATFTAMDAGLPATLVHSLAISPDGEQLFAATEVGPFRYDRASATWQDIAGIHAPDSIYWHVDYVPDLDIARFSTFGRGLWDYRIDSADIVFRDGFE